MKKWKASLMRPHTSACLSQRIDVYDNMDSLYHLFKSKVNFKDGIGGHQDHR